MTRSVNWAEKAQYLGQVTWAVGFGSSLILYQRPNTSLVVSASDSPVSAAAAVLSLFLSHGGDSELLFFSLWIPLFQSAVGSQASLPLRRPPVPGRFFSSSRRRSSKAAAEPPMDAGEPFYVVLKGNVIGIYKTLSECQAQVSNSVCDPSVTVFKGYSLRKDTEASLAARGLRNALYSIDAADARDELFGDLVPCPFQQPDGTSSSTLKRPQEIETRPSKKQPKVAEQEPPLPDSHLSCILEFDGASKGNPGKAGAGAIIRCLDGSVIAQLREGLGIATSNAAEYHALILGLKYAAKKGFKYICAQGDSKLVCNQVQDLWRARNDNMADLCKKVKELKGMFLSFQISHVLREFNSAADVQANFAVELPVSEVQEQSNFPC